MSYLLKIISGPHAGAEVPFDGTISIGSGEDCDILLVDKAIAEHHLEVMDIEGRLLLKCEDPEHTFVNGKALEADEYPLEAFDVIRIGETEVIIGPAEGRWEIPATEPIEGAAEVPTTETAAVVIEKKPLHRTILGAASALAVLGLAYIAWPTDDVSIKPINQPAVADFLEQNTLRHTLQDNPPTILAYVETEKDAHKVVTKLQQLQPKAILRIWSQEKILKSAESIVQDKRLPLKVSVSETPGLVVIVGSLSDNEKQNLLRLLDDVPGIEKIDFQSLSIPDLLKDRHEVLNYTVTEKPKLTFDVYVAKNDEKYPLQLFLTENAPRSNIRIWSQEQIVMGAQDSIRSLQLPLTAYAGKRAGNVVIEGYVFDAQNIGLLKQRLQRDNIGICDIDFQTVSSFDLRNKVHQILTQYGLANLITIQPTPKAILLKGTIDKSSAAKWAEAQRAIEVAIEAVIPLHAQVSVIPEEVQNFFDSPINSVTIGGKDLQWVDLANGSRYFRGSILPSGYVIESILPEKIILRKGTETVTVNIGAL
ncbi:MAG: hypothetical protein A2Y14_01880 [Verrucomicrobia bacterium GWF2_51_19]|nr:MAG: hypothetical protein A2Y14_01880 [Verrucomicrobia bacterium GWF2_51_19]HCJ11899.1 hypothetical protein [Opitutae bacterium]